MGVSTDAIVAFGFDLGEDLPQSLLPDDDGDDYFDFEEWYLAKVGIEYQETDETGEYRKAREEALASCPVEIITHCSYDYPMYFLALTGTRTTASRGCPQEIDPERVADDRILEMCRFCQWAGVDWVEPKWQVFSVWG